MNITTKTGIEELKTLLILEGYPIEAEEAYNVFSPAPQGLNS